jgi:hypothetical protein
MKLEALGKHKLREQIILKLRNTFGQKVMYAFNVWKDLFKAAKLDGMMKNPAIRRIIKIFESMGGFAQKV